MSTEQPIIDAETMPIEALDLRHPSVPATLEQIAALGDGAIENVRARVQVLTTLRKSSIQTTNPQDWLLFHAVDRRTGQERTVAFLQDCGCDRVASIWGIEVFAIEKPERIMANDGTPNFMYIIRGSGRCSITGQIVEQVEGGRSSSDDFCKDKTGTALELATRKAARANLDGNIVRELTGLKSVPLEQLRDAWDGSGKDFNQCVKARGYGSGKVEAQSNAGGGGEPVDMSAPVPNCAKCDGPMWDNRKKKVSPNSPDFKCKDKACGHGVWLEKKGAQSAAAPSTQPATNGDGVVINGVKFPADCSADHTSPILLGSMDEEARRAGVKLLKFTTDNLNTKPNKMNDEAARLMVDVLRAMPDRDEE